MNLSLLQYSVLLTLTALPHLRLPLLPAVVGNLVFTLTIGLPASVNFVLVCVCVCVCVCLWLCATISFMIHNRVWMGAKYHC